MERTAVCRTVHGRVMVRGETAQATTRSSALTTAVAAAAESAATGGSFTAGSNWSMNRALALAPILSTRGGHTHTYGYGCSQMDVTRDVLSMPD